MKTGDGPPAIVVLAEASPLDPAAVGGVSGLLRALMPSAPRSWTLLTPSPDPARSSGSDLGPSLYGSRIPHRLLFPCRLLRLLPRLRALDPALVYTHSNEAAMLLSALRPAGLADFAIVHHQHGSENPLTYATFRAGRAPGLASLYDRVLYRMHRSVERLVVIDDRSMSANLARGVPGERIVLLPNAVDTEVYKPSAEARASAREKLGIPAEAWVVAFAGRLEEVKRVPLLLEAFGMMEGSPFLAVAGSGTRAVEVADLARKSPAASRIVLAGALGPGEMPGFMQAADCLALPSAAEGVPLVVLEAMAAGVPVVATDVGGVAGMVGCAGRILPSGLSARDLADALSEMKRSPPDRGGIRDRALAHSASTAVGLLSKVFDEAIACYRGRVGAAGS